MRCDSCRRAGRACYRCLPETEAFLSESILWGFILAAILAVLGIWMGHGLETVPTTKRQIAAELIVGKIYDYAKQNLGNKAETFAPYMGTIFIYILLGSSLGLLGLRPITADVNVTFSLSFSRSC